MTTYLNILTRRMAVTPPWGPIASPVPNIASGQSFPVLGPECPSYCVGDAALTRDNAEAGGELVSNGFSIVHSDDAGGARRGAAGA